MTDEYNDQKDENPWSPFSPNIGVYFELWKKLQSCTEPEDYDNVRRDMNDAYPILTKDEKKYFKEISNNFEKFGTINPNGNSKSRRREKRKKNKSI